MGAVWRALMAVWTQGPPAYPVYCEAQNTSLPFVSQLNCSALHSCEADCLWPDNSLCQASVHHLKKGWTDSSSDSFLIPSSTSLSCIIGYLRSYRWFVKRCVCHHSKEFSLASLLPCTKLFRKNNFQQWRRTSCCSLKGHSHKSWKADCNGWVRYWIFPMKVYNIIVLYMGNYIFTMMF